MGSGHYVQEAYSEQDEDNTWVEAIVYMRGPRR